MSLFSMTVFLVLFRFPATVLLCHIFCVPTVCFVLGWNILIFPLGFFPCVHKADSCILSVFPSFAMHFITIVFHLACTFCLCNQDKLFLHCTDLQDVYIIFQCNNNFSLYSRADWWDTEFKNQPWFWDTGPSVSKQCWGVWQTLASPWCEEQQ